MPAEDAIFRGAMRLLASGVTIVATNCRGEYSGLTATAVCSLALSPARILASVNRAGRTYERIVESRIMSVNLLAEDHAPLADRFAGRTGAVGEDRFAHAAWEERVTGAPLLGNALAALDCRITEIVQLDTHALLIGVVEDILFGPARAPLLHFDGGFATALAPCSGGRDA
jgi:flavin reductase (NADH)/flavin reductase